MKPNLRFSNAKNGRNLSWQPWSVVTGTVAFAVLEEQFGVRLEARMVYVFCSVS